MKREIDQRTGDGITVTLYHDSELGALTLLVEDDRRADSGALEAIVDPKDARHAFEHPFLYVQEPAGQPQR